MREGLSVRSGIKAVFHRCRRTGNRCRNVIFLKLKNGCKAVHLTTRIFMKKYLLPALLILFQASFAFGQKYYTKTGSIHFLSEAPLEKIEASNGNAYVVFDVGTGQMEWSVLIKGFKFEKALMQEHFNENYMESDKYPKAIFKGSISQVSGINLLKDGNYDVEASGDITIHGVTKPTRAPGRVMVKNGVLTVESSFNLTIADYNIEVPKVVRDNIAKTVKVSVSAQLQSLK